MIRRSSGILLPIFSLPSPYGIGTLGAEARRFTDFLHKAGVGWWQLLPIGPTGYGASPYQSLSSYAGNPDLIDLDQLCEAGLLQASELPEADRSDTVDHDSVSRIREPLFRKAFSRMGRQTADKVARFAEENAAWLEDYALFRALKRHFGFQPWYEWDTDIRTRKPEAVLQYRRELDGEIRYEFFVQYLFFSQWQALRAYAKERGVKLLGDLPIYVALDSADVWSSPESFLLDADCRPTAVAGVPPDYFSEDGQLWGNPLYDWDAMRRDGFGWWIRRIDAAAKCYDALRIDHFRAFAGYWAVPKNAVSAKEGAWKTGPGMELVGVLTGWFPQLQLVAEDLGTLTPDVHRLLADSGLPGMKVLEFAFDDTEQSSYLPHNITENCICYTGTHDNAPLGEWVQNGGERELAFACEYLGCDRKDLPDAMLRAGMQSRAALFVAQMQDWLGLGAESRTNTPGTTENNWRWRLRPGQLTDTLAKKIARAVKIYGRGEE